MSRGHDQLVTMDFLGIQRRKKPSFPPRVTEKSNNWIKPLMVEQAFSPKGLCEEYCKTPRDCQDPKFEAASRIIKELFPQHTGRGSNPTAGQNAGTLYNSSVGRSDYTTPPGKQFAAQLTIFYSGMVNVYNVSEKEAEDIIRLAGNEISSQQLYSAGFDLRTHRKPITVSSRSTSNPTKEPVPLNPSTNSADPQQLLIEKLHTDLPLQRKQSLERFLQNRKEDRMNRAAPYPHSLAGKKLQPERGSTLVGITSSKGMDSLYCEI